MTRVRSKVLLVSMQRGLNMNREREEGKSKGDKNISGRFVSLTSTLQEELESLPSGERKRSRGRCWGHALLVRQECLQYLKEFLMQQAEDLEHEM